MFSIHARLVYFDNLQRKKPMMLTAKEVTEKVSTLIQGMRWLNFIVRYRGWNIWISTP